MIEYLWRMLAVLLTEGDMPARLYERAKRTPYTHITSADGGSVYMGRWWLFNPYPASGGRKRWDWLPSIRLHHICRADQDRHLHDHPWDARTIILRGFYVEERQDGTKRVLCEGDTSPIKHGEYHRIERVSEGGVWTLFITWRYRGTWGFLVDGHKVPHREYLGRAQQE